MKKLISLLFIFSILKLLVLPVQADTKMSEYWYPYSSALNQRIHSNWAAPGISANNKRVVVICKVDRTGQLLSYTIEPSGTSSLDTAFLNAVKASFPFNQFPAEFKGSYVFIRLTFDYNMNRPVMNIYVTETT